MGIQLGGIEGHGLGAFRSQAVDLLLDRGGTPVRELAIELVPALVDGEIRIRGKGGFKEGADVGVPGRGGGLFGWLRGAS